MKKIISTLLLLVSSFTLFADEVRSMLEYTDSNGLSVSSIVAAHKMYGSYNSRIALLVTGLKNGYSDYRIEKLNYDLLKSKKTDSREIRSYAKEVFGNTNMYDKVYSSLDSGVYTTELSKLSELGLREVFYAEVKPLISLIISLQTFAVNTGQSSRQHLNAAINCKESLESNLPEVPVPTVDSEKLDESRELRIRAAELQNVLIEAEKKIKMGEVKIQNAREMASMKKQSGNQRDFERNIKEMTADGNRLKEEGTREKEKILKLYKEIRSTCEIVEVKFLNGKKAKFIPLKFEDGKFSVLIKNKVLKINEADLDDDSKLLMEQYKN